MASFPITEESSFSSITSESFYVRPNPPTLIASNCSSEFNQTMVINSVNQDYIGMGLQIHPSRQKNKSVSSDLSEQEPLPLKPTLADSPALPGQGTRILREMTVESKQSVFRSSLTMPTRAFCCRCGKENLTQVRFEYGGMWDRVQSFLQSIKCCGEPGSILQYQEAVHTCRRCGYTVARIKGRQQKIV